MSDPAVRPFSVVPTAIIDLLVLRAKEVTDGRRTVREFYRESALVEAGLTSLEPWVQLNLTETR